MKFCTACGASLEAEKRFCGACGAAVTAIDGAQFHQGASKIPIPDPIVPEFADETIESKRNWTLWLGLGFVLLLGLLYYFIFINDDRGGEGGTPAAGPAKEQISAPKIVELFTSTTANVRDKPTTEGSAVISKLQRGDAVNGQLVAGITQGDQWLKLADNKGFVSLINLSENPAPALKVNFGEKVIELTGAADLWSAPNSDAQLLDRLSKGLSISASGITANGYLEIILKKGGVGYISGGEKIVSDAAKEDANPAIAIKIDYNGCATGPEISALFKKMADASAAGLKKVEDARYANDDARDAAIDRYLHRVDGKSNFSRIKRSFNGLTVTAIAQHYESQSVYFEDPPEKVRAVFRSQGYKVGKQGKLPSRDIYASIDAAPPEFSAYGKTDLGCGV